MTRTGSGAGQGPSVAVTATFAGGRRLLALGAADTCQHQPGGQAGGPHTTVSWGCWRHSRLSHLGWVRPCLIPSDRMAPDTSGVESEGPGEGAADSRTDAGGRVVSGSERGGSLGRRTLLGSGSPPFLPLFAVTPSPRGQARWVPGAPPCGCLTPTGAPGAWRLDCREELHAFCTGRQKAQRVTPSFS